MGVKNVIFAFVDKGTKPAEVFASRPELDRDASRKLATTLFPRMQLVEDRDQTLDYCHPSRKQVYVGCYPGISLFSTWYLVGDLPSKLPENVLAAAGERDLYFHAMHSVVDWFAFAIWSGGKLTRSLSLSPDDGIMEDIGERLPFEAPYWDGKHPLDSENGVTYPIPFHPLVLGEVTVHHLLGYDFEGYGDWSPDDPVFDPESIALMGFQNIRPWWKFW